MACSFFCVPGAHFAHYPRCVQMYDYHALCLCGGQASWVLRWDAATGAPYFLCEATGKSQWCEVTGALRSLADGTPGFRREVDPATWAPYFVHDALGVMVWAF